MKTPTSLLKTLSRELRRSCTRRKKARRRHVDSGLPIDLRYDSGYHTPKASVHAASFSRGMRDPFSAPFTEEEEEQEDGMPEMMPTWGTGELEELEVVDTDTEDEQTPSPLFRSASRSLSDSAEPGGPVVWGTGELELEAEAATPAPSMHAEAAPAEAQSRRRPEQPPKEKRAHPSGLPVHTPAKDAETAAFEQDLAAILQGTKPHPSTGVQPPPPSEEDTDEAPSPAPPTGLSHETFERMGRNMSMAQTFDLGNFGLERQFQAFDREMDRSERTGAPQPRAPRRAQAQQVVEIASAIVGATMTRILDNQGDVNWELDQLNGLKHPQNDPAKAGPSQYRDVSLDVQGASPGTLLDKIRADFRVRFQCNGRSLGNIQITNTGVNDAVGWGLTVRAHIMDDANVHPNAEDPASYAAVRILFHYRFTRAIGSEVLAEASLKLFGNGTHELDFRWIQSAALSTAASVIIH